jgi:hypothetical protein
MTSITNVKINNQEKKEGEPFFMACYFKKPSFAYGQLYRSRGVVLDGTGILSKQIKFFSLHNIYCSIPYIPMWIHR